MSDSSKTEATSIGAATGAIHKACCDHAENLIRAADKIADDPNLSSIAYHLAALALEEIGKADLVVAKAATQRKGNSVWIDKRLDDHVAKLMWALWTPAFAEISPAQLEQSRELAKQIHENRLDGLYVSVDPEGELIEPRNTIGPAAAANLIGLSRSRLEMERERTLSESFADDEDLIWFLDAASDKEKSRTVFSKESVRRFPDFNGDVKAWVKWLRSESEKAESEARAAVARELARNKPVGEDAAKLKWRIEIKLETTSLSIRPKILNLWNKLDGPIRLRPVGNDKNALLVELDLTASISFQGVWYAGLGMSRAFVTALNIATTGFIWWYKPLQTCRFYERIQDLDEPRMNVVIERQPRQDFGMPVRAMDESDLARTSQCLSFISSLTRADGDVIFSPYITGLAFLSKSDVHFDFSVDARRCFSESLFSAMRIFGDWDGSGAKKEEIFHALFEKAFSEKEIRNELFEILTRQPRSDDREDKASHLDDAIKCKVVCDIYLNRLATRLAAEKTASEEKLGSE